MKQKGLAPLIIIILIALAVGGFLIYQKQFKPAVPQLVTQSSPSPVASDETANWKTYTNKDYGYSFKYPNDLIISDSFNSNGNIHTTTIGNYNNDAFSGGEKDQDDIDVFLMFVKTSEENPNLKARSFFEPQNKLENYIVGGIPGFKVGESRFGTVVVTYKKKEYQFDLRPFNSNYADYFYKILSTFKFLP